MAVPPVPFDSMCQDQPTLPLPPMVCAVPLNDTGNLPVEYITLAEQTAPGELYAYRVGCDPYDTGFGLTDCNRNTLSTPKGQTLSQSAGTIQVAAAQTVNLAPDQYVIKQADPKGIYSLTFSATDRNGTSSATTQYTITK